MYGERYMTLNVNVSLHLSNVVTNYRIHWGYITVSHLRIPMVKLWSYFMALNMLTANVNILQLLPEMMEAIQVETEAYKFVTKLRPDLDRTTDALKCPIQTLGKGYTIKLSDLIFVKMSSQLGYLLTSEDLIFNNRIKINSIMLNSKAYDRVISRNSYTVKYIP